MKKSRNIEHHLIFWEGVVRVRHVRPGRGQGVYINKEWRCGLEGRGGSRRSKTWVNMR